MTGSLEGHELVDRAAVKTTPSKSTPSSSLSPPGACLAKSRLKGTGWGGPPIKRPKRKDRVPLLLS